MTLESQFILVADYVPLANKGEEAIVRGIEDMFYDGRPVVIGLFDNVRKVTHYGGNIVVFPREWVFRLLGSGITGRKRFLYGILIVMQIRFGYYSKLNNIIKSTNKVYKPLQEFFDKADYVFVGHDGVLGIESCGIIHLVKKVGKYAGVLGSGVRIPLRWVFHQNWLFRRLVDESDFCVCREHFSSERMLEISKNPAKVTLAPDPAFAMTRASDEEAKKVLSEYQLYDNARNAKKAIVAVTVREKGIPYRKAFPEYDPETKKRVHAGYVANILDTLIRDRNAFIVFLPHAIEQPNSDITAARHVAEVMSSDSNNYLILDRDINARVLKSIIRECDFLVGERAHSLIGSVSVGTPFVALTNSSDYRTYGIIGDMCNCLDQIIDVNLLNKEIASKKTLYIYDNRKSVRNALCETGKMLSVKLGSIVEHIKSGRICNK